MSVPTRSSFARNPADILVRIASLLSQLRASFASYAPPRLDDRLLADIGLLKCDLLFPDAPSERAD